MQFPPSISPNDSPLYCHDPDLTVLAIYFEFNVSVPRRGALADPSVIFVPVSTLNARIQVATSMLSRPHTITVPWDDWGPAGTRIVRFESPCELSAMGCSVAATQTKWTGPDATLKIFVFDVHPLAGKRGRPQARARLKDARAFLCATDTLLETPAFAGRITTTFPFELTARDVSLGMNELYSPVALGEDGLVLVTPAASS